MPRLPKHKGDGTFSDLSFKARGVYPILGYQIDMPEFDLTRPFDRTYRVSDLPIISAELGCNVGLVIRSDFGIHGPANRLQGCALSFCVADSHGKKVVDVHDKGNDYVWQGVLRIDEWESYQLEKTFFRPRKGEKYEIRVTYNPAPNGPKVNGHLRLHEGGSE